MGITRLGNVTGFDRMGIPVAVAVRPNSRSVSVSQGKGLGLSQALASALMEAIELFHAEEPHGRAVEASFLELSENARVVHPGCSPAGDFVARPGQNKMDRGIRSSRARDLLGSLGCCAYRLHAATRHSIEQHHFVSGSNGLASGNHLVEAVSSAICELIERDAVAVWNARNLRERSRCHLDVGSIDDGDCRALLELYEAAQMRPRCGM